MKNAFSPFLGKTSCLSIWEVGLRWAGYEDREEYEKNLPQPAKDAMRAIMNAQCADRLSVILDYDFPEVMTSQLFPEDEDGEEWAPRRISPRGRSEVEHAQDYHEQIIREGRYEPWYLRIVYVDRVEMAKWSLQMSLPFPDFWFSVSEKTALLEELGHQNPEGVAGSAGPVAEAPGRITRQSIDEFWQRLNHKQRARLMAREMAAVLWKENPDLTITTVSNHQVIQHYCGAKMYTDKNTVRNWISDLDPREPSKKVGRPRRS